jgi:hypothetical protein
LTSVSVTWYELGAMGREEVQMSPNGIDPFQAVDIRSIPDDQLDDLVGGSNVTVAALKF